MNKSMNKLMMVMVFISFGLVGASYASDRDQSLETTAIQPEVGSSTDGRYQFLFDPDSSSNVWEEDEDLQ